LLLPDEALPRESVFRVAFEKAEEETREGSGGRGIKAGRGWARERELRLRAAFPLATIVLPGFFLILVSETCSDTGVMR
jgi:hypothetical protein